ncbi:MAG: magnesium transporter [Chloroflexi bacterium]|nr:magnesium transporter [Chloroflexota bacterium]
MDEKKIDHIIEEIRIALQSGNLKEAINALVRLHPADRAEAFSDLDNKDQAALLPGMDIPVAADLLEELEDEQAADVAISLPTELLADVLDEMEPDEAADVLGDIPPARAAEALAEMEDAKEVIPLLSYPDETAGGLMTTSYVAIQPSFSAAQAIGILRQIGTAVETPYYLYVVDDVNYLIGIVGMRKLIIAQPEDLVQSFMDTDVIAANAIEDQEMVARLMSRYDLTVMPVIDDNGYLQGVITHDDLVDVIEEEATEDIYRLANISDSDLSIHSPVGISVRRRLPWLFLNSITALFAAWVISNFENLFQQVALLAVFQSVVAGIGGNAATQSLAMIVRAYALGEIPGRVTLKPLYRQVAIGIIQGLAVGLVVGFGVYLWKGNVYLGLIISLALAANILIAAVVGTLIPLGLRALNQDPALASSVLVTAITDSVGFAIFLGLATLFLSRLT